MPHRADAYRGLAHASRFQILKAVSDEPGLGLDAISQVTGLHVNTLRDHLRVLTEEGLIHAEVEHRPSRGRPRNVYYAVDSQTESEHAQKRVDLAKEHGDLLRRISDIDTGDLDNESLHQLDALYEHLDDVGLQPEMEESELRIEMRPCQFHGILQEHQDLVCSVHERLIRDVLDRAGGPVEVDSLKPLVTPHNCQLQLRVKK